MFERINTTTWLGRGTVKPVQYLKQIIMTNHRQPTQLVQYVDLHMA